MEITGSGKPSGRHVGGGRNRRLHLNGLKRIRYLYYGCVAIMASLVLLAPGPGQAPEAFT